MGFEFTLDQTQFEPAKLVSLKPSFAGLGGQLQLADLDADDGKQLVSYGTEPRGYFELNDFANLCREQLDWFVQDE